MLKRENNYKDIIKNIRGKTIALIYIYEGDQTSGYAHYDVWKSDVICSWMSAINELRAYPLLFDLRTFITKSTNCSLPQIDYIVNLNNGTLNVSTLGVVPSLCSYLSIPCIPGNTLSTVVGEDKLLSNHIAAQVGINVPNTLSATDNTGIMRPRYYGSSIGVKKGSHNLDVNKFIYQEFICGFDLTTPILYNPLSNDLELLPSTIYIPTSKKPDWFLGEEEKKKHEGYVKEIVHLPNNIKSQLVELAKTFNVKTYCRIDARIKCNDNYNSSICNNIGFKDLHFLEINTMPTIKDNINFHTSIQGLDNRYMLYTCKEIYSNEVEKHSLTGFILANSIAAFIATHEK